MACPFFVPQGRLDPGAWTHRPRLPLGDAYSGFCQAPLKELARTTEPDSAGQSRVPGSLEGRAGPVRAQFGALSDTSFTPPEEHQREHCNNGYARGLCEHFPVSGAADAVRFSVTEDGGGFLRVVYIFEKDHAPLSHGVLNFPAAEASPIDNLLLRQARAFVESYMKARGQTERLEARSATEVG